MQTCSICNTQSPDLVKICPKCQADLSVSSTTAVARKALLENPRVTQVNIAVSDDACPACRSVQGTYTKDKLPMLPVEGCSNPNGCNSFYQPLLDEIFP